MKNNLIIFSIFALTCYSNLYSKNKINGGILPYMYDKKGNAFFLIGQEPNGTWADFGDHADKTDPSYEYTAIREFSEETRYVYGRYHLGAQLTNKDRDYAKLLEASNQYIRPRTKTKFFHPRGWYVMYLAEVDFIPAHVFGKAHKVPHYEKRSYRWVSANKFLSTIESAHDREHARFRGMHIRKQFYDVVKHNMQAITHTIYPKTVLSPKTSKKWVDRLQTKANPVH